VSQLTLNGRGVIGAGRQDFADEEYTAPPTKSDNAAMAMMIRFMMQYSRNDCFSLHVKVLSKRSAEARDPRAQSAVVKPIRVCTDDDERPLRQCV
jgi:hypothetical protein